MKKLIGKVLLLVTAVWVLGAVYIESCPMAFFNFEYPMWAYQKAQVRSTSGPDARILVVGDSRALADLLPADLSHPRGTAVTLAVGGATPIESWHLLDDYLANNAPPEAIFLSLSPYHLTRCDVFWQRTVKFKFLDLDDFLEVLALSRELDDYPFDDFRTDPLEPPVARRFMPFEIYRDFALLYLDFLYYYQADLYGGRLFGRRDGNLRVLEEMADGLGRRAVEMTPANEPLNHEARLDEFRESPLLNHYLHRFLDRCRREGSRVVFETAPFNGPSHQALKPAWRAGYRRYLDRLAERYPEFSFVREIPLYPDHLFGDESHLNHRGAVEYTESVRERFFPTYGSGGGG